MRKKISIYIRKDLPNIPVKIHGRIILMSLKRAMRLRKVSQKINADIVIKECPHDEICQIYCHLNCDMIIVNGEIGKILFFRLQKTFENTKQLEKPLCECNLGNYVCKEIREDLKNVIH